jgi:hypothetical protein
MGSFFPVGYAALQRFKLAHRIVNFRWKICLEWVYHPQFNRFSGKIGPSWKTWFRSLSIHCEAYFILPYIFEFMNYFIRFWRYKVMSGFPQWHFLHHLLMERPLLHLSPWFRGLDGNEPGPGSIHAELTTMEIQQISSRFVIQSIPSNHFLFSFFRQKQYLVRTSIASAMYRCAEVFLVSD